MAISKGKTKSPTKRSLGVILESIGSDVKQVLEGHSALDTKFDKKIDEFRHEMRSEIGLLRVGHQALTSRAKDIEIKIDIVDGNIRDLQSGSKQILEYLSRMDDEIKDLKSRLDKKADRERLVGLEKRIARVELVVKKYYKHG